MERERVKQQHATTRQSAWITWTGQVRKLVVHDRERLTGNLLVGLVAKASTSRMADPGFDSHLPAFCWVESIQ